MTDDNKSSKKSRPQSPKSKAAYVQMRKDVEAAHDKAVAARQFGIGTPREHYIHDKIEINDPNFWRELSLAMVDSFDKDREKLELFGELLETLDFDVKSSPEYQSEADEKTVDKYDPLLHIMAFVFGVGAVTAPEQVSSQDIRRVMASINSVKRSLLQYRKASAERSEAERKQNALHKLRRADVRRAAQIAVEQDIDPFDLGSVRDPQVVDTVMEMYRIMKMQRNQAVGQNALATARLAVLRIRVRSLMNRHHTLLKKTPRKGKASADLWREEELKKHKEEDKKVVEERRAEAWREKYPRSKKYRVADKKSDADKKPGAEVSSPSELESKSSLTDEEIQMMEELGIPIDEEE